MFEAGIQDRQSVSRDSVWNDHGTLHIFLKFEAINLKSE